MLGALSLSKRLRAGDPGYKFLSVRSKTRFAVGSQDRGVVDRTASFSQPGQRPLGG